MRDNWEMQVVENIILLAYTIMVYEKSKMEIKGKTRR